MKHRLQLNTYIFFFVRSNELITVDNDGIGYETTVVTKRSTDLETFLMTYLMDWRFLEVQSVIENPSVNDIRQRPISIT